MRGSEGTSGQSTPRAWLRLPWRRVAPEAPPPVEAPKPPRRIEPEPPPKAWTQLEIETLPTAIPLKMQRDLNAGPEFDVEPEIYGRVQDILQGRKGDQALLEPGIHLPKEEVKRAVGEVAEPWLPTQAPRVETMDPRRGYRHTWQLRERLGEIRRPYLLRLDLARVKFEDAQPVEEMLVPVPLGERASDLMTPEPIEVEKRELAPPLPRVGPEAVPVLGRVALASDAMERPPGRERDGPGVGSG